MTELLDYQRMVEKPMLRQLHREIAELKSELARLKSASERPLEILHAEHDRCVEQERHLLASGEARSALKWRARAACCGELITKFKDEAPSSPTEARTR